MSLSEFQACLARLYVDDCFRQLFWAEPAKVLSSYDLSDAEVSTIRAVDQQMVERFSSSLKNKRKTKLRRSYPLLFLLDGAEFDRFYKRYFQLFISHERLSSRDDALSFGNFMADLLAGAQGLPAYAYELARYERLCLLTSNIRHDGVASSVYLPVTYDLRPCLARNVLMQKFEYDLPTIIKALESHVPPAQVECRPAVGPLIFKGNNQTRGEVFSVNSATEIILQLCDGRRL